MSEFREPPKAQVLLSLLAADWPAFWPGLRQELTARLGAIDYESPPLPFDQTDFYDAELGTPIVRRLLAFEPLAPQGDLVAVKLWAHALERRLARPDGRRVVNLDPGLLTMERLVLATGKNFTHRVYLGCGVFADLTLIWRKRLGWQSLPWTFADYAGPALQACLTTIRERYHAKRNHEERG